MLSEANTISEDEACEYMFDLLCAINYCHQKGIIHSDLKPENLLFTQSRFKKEIVKINDFSTSRLALNSSNKQSQLSGTVSLIQIFYMSPEQLQGQVSTKSDIWSLGVILYMMLSKQ
jgi:serine/threonine protein kinase